MYSVVGYPVTVCLCQGQRHCIHVDFGLFGSDIAEKCMFKVSVYNVHVAMHVTRASVAQWLEKWVGTPRL